MSHRQGEPVWQERITWRSIRGSSKEAGGSTAGIIAPRPWKFPLQSTHGSETGPERHRGQAPPGLAWPPRPRGLTNLYCGETAPETSGSSLRSATGRRNRVREQNVSGDGNGLLISTNDQGHHQVKFEQACSHPNTPTQGEQTMEWVCQR